MRRATTGLALSLLFHVASSLLPGRWRRLVRLRCSSRARARGEATGSRLGAGVAGVARLNPLRGAQPPPGDAAMRRDAVTACSTPPPLRQSACKGKPGPGLGKAWSSAANLRLCLRDWGFALSNWIARTNKWGQLHLKMGLGWYLNL